MAERKKIICPRCDAVVAVVPEEGLRSTDLTCSNCGAELRAPGPIEEAAETVKALLRDAEEKIRDRLRSR